MEDCTPDLFFERYREILSEEQLQSWRGFRSRLEQYYDKMPRHPEPAQVLDDPERELVRQAARSFTLAFMGTPT
jgi:hypothetical protein